MRPRQLKILNLFGIIAPLWLVAGVTIAGALYPGYDHYNQAMSELHARGSAVEQLTPLLNHYPLTLLFIGFGVFVYHHAKQSRPAQISAMLIAIHGMATFVAGYFPCDTGCQPENSSSSQLIHGIAGGVLFLSLLIAQLLWIYLSIKRQTKTWFGVFTLLCVLLALVMIPAMGLALESGAGFGLYQRLNYGASLCWMLVLALVLRAPFKQLNGYDSHANRETLTRLDGHNNEDQVT